MWRKREHVAAREIRAFARNAWRNGGVEIAAHFQSFGEVQLFGQRTGITQRIF